METEPSTDAGEHGAEALVRECLAVFERLSVLAKRGDDAWRGLDLTMGQFKAVCVLCSRGPQSVGELGRALRIAEPSASLLAAKLDDLGLACHKTDPNDRRRTLIVPTPAAVALHTRVRQIREELMTQWLANTDADDLAALLQGLRGVARAAETIGEASPGRTVA